MYKKNTHIHFIGIGGIGMSAIATVLQQQGYQVSGCDSCQEQKSIRNLLALGCAIASPNYSTSCHDASIDIIVYSAAISPHNQEILAARQRGIPVVSRAKMLAQIMRSYESIAVAGSHGKTTTSSLISHVLLEAQLDPTIIIGGHLQSIGTNGRLGTSKFLVAEADESDRSLTILPVSIAIITNISLEHLDTYKNIDDIKQTFIQFLTNLPFYGKAILCIDDPNTADLFKMLSPELQKQVITYGFTQQANFCITEHQLDPGSSTATLLYKNSNLGGFTVAMPGKHNLLNAAATFAVAHELEQQPKHSQALAG
jgi:UDP-N-acetylmuramate--alanine ligase